ncbi:MAG: hypothetical protein FWG87_13695 [Defluviitaleaceae bacterium]|nr:hypothetical protein [Defluviitaleaceae bacterium]
MSDSNKVLTNRTLANEQPDILASLKNINMTVTPYGEVKKYLDEKARETMYKLKDVANNVLSFSGDKDE